MVITARRDEARPWHVTHNVEPDKVVIETQRRTDVGDVQVNMAHPRARRHRLVQFVLFVQMAEQLVEVDRVAAGPRIPFFVIGDESAVGEPHRAVLGRLGVDLDTVAVGVPQVVRLRHDVVRRVLLPSQTRQPADHPGELAAIGHDDREVVKA